MFCKILIIPFRDRRLATLSVAGGVLLGADVDAKQGILPIQNVFKEARILFKL